MNTCSEKSINFSIVIPCYNEEKSLKELYERLSRTFSDIQGTYELIFVDDGSTDNTLYVLKELFNRDKRVKILHMRKNFGKSQALSQGFENCRGNIIITLDSDLQDMPEEIPKLLKHLENGFDMVSGWKKKRNDTLGRRIASRIFNFFASSVTGIKIHDFNCGLKVYKHEVTKNLSLYGEIYRFIPALAGWKGFIVGETVVKHAQRKYGKSKFGAERFMRGFLDLITIIFLIKYIQRPMHLFGPLGITLSFIGCVVNTYLAFLWFVGEHIGHRPLLLLGTLLIIIGIQFVFFGLLGELIVFSSRKKTDSILKDTFGIE